MKPHPAKFSKEILAGLEHLIPDTLMVLDPLAGVGGIRTVAPWAVCIELEPEWAEQCGHPVIVADSTHMPLRSNLFVCICTSPVYGNRMSDHHDAKERCRKCGGAGGHRKLQRAACTRCGGKGYNVYKRHTYRHYLERPLHPRNTGQLQWGKQYCSMHEEIWRECHRVLIPGGVFILNISDHIRKYKLQRVARWHVRTLESIGFHSVDAFKVRTPRQQHGQNREARVEHEYVFRFIKV